MTDLNALLAEADRAQAAFEDTLAPNGYADRWHFYKADDNRTGFEKTPGHDIVIAAHKAWLAKLHAFYLARDGAGGVLGGRGL